MKIFNKLVNILFDEEEEIPTITKEEKKIEEPKSKPINSIKEEEVKVTKIEHKPAVEEDLFDMPKLSEEEPKKEEKKKNNFSFPLIDDEEDLDFATEKRSNKYKEQPKKEEKKKYDYLSSTDYKYKSDAYTANRNNLYEPGEAKKPFTLSPIISPVYGVLNENYRKEDIVEKNSSRDRNRVDLDSVRRKAYGTLEDEIEASLNKNDDVLEEVSSKTDMTLDSLKDDGLSVHDLLVENEFNDEIFDIGTEEINPDDEDESRLEVPKTNSVKKDVVKEDSSDDDDDLFDLIDSLYTGKDEDDD